MSDIDQIDPLQDDPEEPEIRANRYESYFDAGKWKWRWLGKLPRLPRELLVECFSQFEGKKVFPDGPFAQFQGSLPRHLFHSTVIAFRAVRADREADLLELVRGRFLHTRENGKLCDFDVLGVCPRCLMTLAEIQERSSKLSNASMKSPASNTTSSSRDLERLHASVETEQGWTSASNSPSVSTPTSSSSILPMEPPQA